MTRTVEVPISLIKSMTRALAAFERLGDELEDYLLSGDEQFIQRMRQARAAHTKGQTRSLAELKKELCIE